MNKCVKTFIGFNYNTTKSILRFKILTMSKKVNLYRLDYYLWHPGPYIIFYNGDCTGYNDELVKNMNTMAAKYPALQVFELSWEEKKTYTVGVEDEVMNTVFLYSHGQLREREFYPDKNKIDDIFKKAIDFYNQNIENRIKKMGCFGKKFEQNLPLSTLPQLVEFEKKKIERIKKHILKKKITFINDSLLPSENLEKSKLLLKNIKVENSIKGNDNFSTNYEKIEKSKMCYLKPDSKKMKIDVSFEKTHIDEFFCLPKKIQRQRENLKRISHLSTCKSIKETTQNTIYQNLSFNINPNKIQNFGFPEINQSNDQGLRKIIYSTKDFYKTNLIKSGNKNI